MSRIDAVGISFFGKGAIGHLPEELKRLNAKKALVITDSFLYESGVADRVGSYLLDGNVAYAIYYQVRPNPDVSVIEECLMAARELEVDLLVAVGGGSAIDTAKAVSIVMTNGGCIQEYEGVSKSNHRGMPIVAVNTTAGTGSEVTRFYIVTDETRYTKMAMVDDNCMVRIAINDTDFMMSMPKGLTAATGMDAMTHGIEALMSKRANPYTDKDALWALETIRKYLPTAVLDGSNQQAREQMAYAAYTAGMAFSNAGLGMVHAMAHALGGRYNLPHGRCNAILLPFVLEYHADFEQTRPIFVKIANLWSLPFQKAEQMVIKEIRNLSRQIGIEESLNAFSIVSPDDFSAMAEQALKDACMADNPVFAGKEELIQVYKQAYEFKSLS